MLLFVNIGLQLPNALRIGAKAGPGQAWAVGHGHDLRVATHSGFCHFFFLSFLLLRLPLSVLHVKKQVMNFIGLKG